MNEMSSIPEMNEMSEYFQTLPFVIPNSLRQDNAPPTNEPNELKNNSQWRALPNYIKNEFIPIINKFEETQYSRVIRVIDGANCKSYFIRQTLLIPIDFIHWLMNVYLVNVDYYDPLFQLREAYTTTAEQLYENDIILQSEMFEEYFEENPNEDFVSVDETFYL